MEISRKIKLHPQTIINIKQKLERSKVIREYSAMWNYGPLNIQRRSILFSSEDLSLEEDRKLLGFAQAHFCVVRLTRLIGQYDLLMEVEGENILHKDVLKEVRSEFNIKRFKVIQSSKIIKEKFISPIWREEF